jgi:hypothetical protein
MYVEYVKSEGDHMHGLLLLTNYSDCPLIFVVGYTLSGCPCTRLACQLFFLFFWVYVTQVYFFLLDGILHKNYADIFRVYSICLRCDMSQNRKQKKQRKNPYFGLLWNENRQPKIRRLELEQQDILLYIIIFDR